jgi:CYTH domain-containing protein
VFTKEPIQPHPKYARVERERRFLLDKFPQNAAVARNQRITDRYIERTHLRLREQCQDGGQKVFKLTQKIPARAAGAQQGFITTMYLSKQEFELLAVLPAGILRKTRYSMPPFGIDVFEGTLHGLLVAEVEFDSHGDADAFAAPPFAIAEVTDDDRFTGGRLVTASRAEIESWVSPHGIIL